VTDEFQVVPILRDAALEGGLQGQESPRGTVPPEIRNRRQQMREAMRILHAMRTRSQQGAGSSDDALANLRSAEAWANRHGGDGLPDVRPWEPGARRGR